MRYYWAAGADMPYINDMKPRITVLFALVIVAFGLRAIPCRAFVWPGTAGGSSGDRHWPLESKAEGRYNPENVLFDSLHTFDALNYQLDLNFVTPSAYFSGAMTLRFEVVSDSISDIRLNMVALVADSAFIGASPTDFTRDDTSIVVGLGGMRLSPETLSVRICYHDTLSGRGFYYYPQNSYTMAEPQDARWWFPCYDEPWDKAASEIYATVPENYKVGSNGHLAGVTSDPLNHTKTYHWINDFPIATYLINLIMGDYAAWNDYYVRPEGDSVPIFYMVAHGDSADAAYDFATIPDMIAVYSGLFGPYPFNKYGQGAVSPFAFGGMENQTMTTINRYWITGDRAFEPGYAHELSHMWWGDCVTLADWRHIWLNEGFATYSSALYNEARYGHEAFMEDILAYQNEYFNYEQNAGRHPLFNPADLFGTDVYVKGAWALHMLRGVMGDSAFFEGLKNYTSAFAYSNASTWEFRDIMEIVSGQSLNWFFDEWVFGQGYPEYDYAWSYESAGDIYLVHLDIAQVQENAPLFDMPMTVRIVAGGNNDFDIHNFQPLQSYDFAVGTPPETLILDPDTWILKRSRQVSGIDIPGGDILPTEAKIDNVYPNPFNNSANISFSIQGRAQEIGLSIYDIAGRLVRSLLSGRFQPKRYVISWDGLDNSGSEMASGVYLVRLAGSHQASTKKITFLR
jgi:aminopeptidase N